MPDNNQRIRYFCPYCQDWSDVRYVGEHVASPEHTAAVKRVKRSTAYRNRQGELPFPPTLHDPPKLR